MSFFIIQIIVSVLERNVKGDVVGLQILFYYYVTMAGMEYNRSDLPFASDAAVLELFNDTRSWVTNRGLCFVTGEVYGLPSEMVGEMLVPDKVMLGTAPVSYRADVALPTLLNCAPEAVRTLRIADRGIDVEYTEPYYSVGKDDELQYNSATAQFLVRPRDQTRANVFYTMMVDQQGSVASSYFMPGAPKVPDLELKVHEHGALTEIVHGLGRLSNKTALRKLSW
jgi:hypothetical protein